MTSQIQRLQALQTAKDRTTLEGGNGRFFVACGRQAEKIRRESTKFKEQFDRVTNMKLTGNPTNSDILRCASLLYSDGSQSMSHVVCAAPTTTSLNRLNGWMLQFIANNTTNLAASGCESESRKSPERPMGTKLGNKIKQEKERAQR